MSTKFSYDGSVCILIEKKNYLLKKLAFKRAKIKIKVYLKKILFIFGFRKSESFLAKINGLIHVGANIGQDRELYAQYSLNVIWIEPVPEIFRILEDNLVGFNRQQAIQACASDLDDQEIVFKVSNNNGGSSSMFNFGLHTKAFPEVDFLYEFSTMTIRLSSLIKKFGIEIKNFKALVLDVQGAELRVLKGSIEILNYLDFVKVEVSDYEAYEGGCTADEIVDFLHQQGFEILCKTLLSSNESVGNYYDYLFQRITPSII